ncbi:MAG: hypothetical protein L0241_00260 [Planctomycetia bacterium]|nr:hypothetical protein [Planctomycetia bacterium]
MIRVSVASTLLLTVAVIAAEPLPVAPEPRPARPELSLVVVEELSNEKGLIDKARVLRIGFHKGKKFPAEKVWEGDVQFVSGSRSFGHHLRLVNNRYLVTDRGGVIDLNEKKVIHNQQDGELDRIDGTKVIYTLANRQDVDVLSFDLTTRKLNFEHKKGKGKYGLTGELSPDGLKAIESGPIADELVLHQPGEKPKTLGKGFHIEIGPLASVFGPTPVLWLDDKHCLTQRGNGKLVTVDLDGKVTEVVTIKDAPKDLVSAPYFLRDGSNRVVYVCGREAYSIDFAKKTWAKYEWLDLGHEFDASCENHQKFGRKLRYKGKEIGWFHCWPHDAKTVPGYLALPAASGQERVFSPKCVAVWSATTGEWTSLEYESLGLDPVVGWVK